MQTIYFGAPGTGKSHTITEYLKSLRIPDDRIFRITFHPEYTYNDFIGQLVPTIIMSGPHAGDITYAFQKGQFTKALEKAFEDTSKDVYLVIEEMTRGNCSSIFGDIFQLLDRVKDGPKKGESRYPIRNEMIAKDIPALPTDEIILPPNFSILGTINTSDQNVFAMDSAFKRRFEWKYVSIDPIGTPPKNNIVMTINNGSSLIQKEWIDFYTKLDEFIASSKYLGLGEDKQIGQFFIEFDLTKTWVEHKEQIQNKLLHYLWFDIEKVSYKTELKLFDSNISSFGDLYKKFSSDEKVFSDSLLAIL